MMKNGNSNVIVKMKKTEKLTKSFLYSFSQRNPKDFKRPDLYPHIHTVKVTSSLKQKRISRHPLRQQEERKKKNQTKQQLKKRTRLSSNI